MEECDLVHDLLSDVSSRVGKLIARHPIYFVLIPLVIALSLTSGVYRLEFFRDYETLYIPRNARSLEERKIVESMFPMNLSTDFDMLRMTRLGRTAMIIITPRDNETVIKPNLLRKVYQVHNAVLNITIQNDEKKWNYNKLCAKKNRKCSENTFITLIKGSRNYKLRKMKYPVEIDLMTIQYIPTAMYLGGVELDEYQRVVFARAIRLIYSLDDGNEEKLNLAKKWESAFIQTINSIQYEDLQVTAFSTLSIEMDIHKITENGLPLGCVAVPLMGIVAVLTCMGSDWVRSKPWLGISGFLTASMSVGSAVGSLLYCNFDFVDINAGVVLIIYVLTMHNSFIFLAEWRNTGSSHSVEKRLGDTYGQAGPMLALSCLAVGFVFLLACSLPYYVIQVFSAYIIVSVAFSFIYTVTFFGGCVALSGYREETNLHPITCLHVKPLCLSAERNILFRWFCTGGSPSNLQDNQKQPKHFLMVFFQEQLGGLLKSKAAQLVIAITFAIYLIIAGWLCTRIKENFDYTSIFPYNSYSQRFVKLFYTYFTDYPQRIQLVINKTVDFSNPEEQAKVAEIIQKFENCSYSGGDGLTDSWLKYFNIFINDFRGKVILYLHTLSKKSDYLDALTNYFLRLEPAAGFKSDIHFDSDKTDIIYSRFHIQIKGTRDSHTEMQMVKAIRQLADTSELPVIVQNYWFAIYDIFIGISRLYFQFTGTTILVLVIVSFIFAPHPFCTFLVFSSFLSIQFGVVAYSSVWNMDFSAILVCSQIGCSVIPILFSLQIPHLYHKVEGKKRIQKTLYYAGMPILQTSLPLTIGLFIISFAPVPVFALFFKVAFLTILLSTLHAYFVIPTILMFYEWSFPPKVRRKSFRRASIRASITEFKASIKSRKESTEDVQPMSVSDDAGIESDEESGISHSFSDFNSEMIEFEDRGSNYSEE